MLAVVTRFLIKIALAIFVRSAFCKLSVPLVGCNTPLCPLAVGGSGDCQVTANTAEQMAWCEHAWGPHFANYGLSIPCTEADNYFFLRALGVVELGAYLCLWSASLEKMGAWTLFIIMIGAIHMHMVHLGDGILDLVFPQVTLALGAFSLLLIPTGGSSKDSKRRD